MKMTFAMKIERNVKTEVEVQDCCSNASFRMSNGKWEWYFKQFLRHTLSLQLNSAKGANNIETNSRNMDIFSNLEDFLNEEDNDAPVYETPTTSNASAVFMSLHSTDKMDDKQSDNTADQMNAHSEVKLLGKQTKTQKAKMLRLKKLKDIVNTAPQAEQKKKTRKKKGVVGGDGETERVGKDRVHVVNLCSDDDGDFQPIAINTNFSAQKAFDLSGNEEMSVNLKFHTEFSRVNARPFQKISDLMENFARKKQIDPSTIHLLYKGKVISPQDSLHSIDYVPGLVITIQEGESGAICPGRSSKVADAEKIDFKFQSATRKRTFVKSVNKKDKLKTLVFECAEELEVDPSRIRLTFDGDTLDLGKNAEENELEGGELIDCFVVSQTTEQKD